MFAQLNRNSWGEMPDEWQRVSKLFDLLTDRIRKTNGHYLYQIVFGRSMFGGVDYNCTLVKWGESKWGEPYSVSRKREVLFETTDPKHAEAILTMMLSVAEEEFRAKREMEIQLCLYERKDTT
jgi:hypothetical protein